MLIGSSHSYVYINPAVASSKDPKITWDFAQKEIASFKGIYKQNVQMTEGNEEFLQ